jgi:hypothetical protein
MAKRSKPETSAEQEPAAPAAIDGRSPEIVLAYVGGPTPRDVPTRDLHGGDLARIAYVRALFTARQELDVRRPQDAPDDMPLPHPKRPKPATSDQLEAIAAELIALGSFTRVEASPDEPASPEV